MHNSQNNISYTSRQTSQGGKKSSKSKKFHNGKFFFETLSNLFKLKPRTLHRKLVIKSDFFFLIRPPPIDPIGLDRNPV